ncbi:MAG: hypothetical protein KFF50_17695 [Desulfatitalea sp.]|nr:hypothetical protein [Desulfatitalea sp.]
MDHEGLQIIEKIDEVTRMCAREHPIYEQISNFSIALYVLGFFDCPDLMSFDDVDAGAAAEYLKEHFVQVSPDALPTDYHISESDAQYLAVFGDPAFPEHFAVLVDSRSTQPYFSKLKFFGSGFDSLDALRQEFLGKDGVGEGDLAFFRRKRAIPARIPTLGRIYTIRKDGDYAVFEEQIHKQRKEANACR